VVRNGLNAPSLLLKHKTLSYAHSVSNSSTTKEITFLDSDSNRFLELTNDSRSGSNMNSGFSKESRTSTSSTRANSPSCIMNCWYDEDDDIKDAMSCPLTDKKFEYSDIYTDTEYLCRPKDHGGIEVIARGTKLMATILFPSVIIRMDKKKKLNNSSLYFVLLKPSSGTYFKEIACVMFSSPHGSVCNTAEILPLRAVKLSTCPDGLNLLPMLLDHRYRSIFEIGCKFKITAFEKGRLLNMKSRKWSDYDLKNPDIHQLLRRLLYLEINQIPRMFNSFWSSLVAEQFSGDLIAVKTKSHPELDFQVNFRNETVSNINTNVSPRRRHSRTSSFGQFFVPPQIRVTKVPGGNCKAKLRNDDFGNSFDLNEYITLSGKI